MSTGYARGIASRQVSCYNRAVNPKWVIRKGDGRVKLNPEQHWETGWNDYLAMLPELIGSYASPDVLELGGGARPMWSLDEAPANLNTYTVNDIDQRELDKLPPGYQTACFDVCGDASAFSERYDVVFSRFLAEHVPDGYAMHRSVWQVLKPGGVAIHIIPTLYASPFVLNALLPERLSYKLLVKVMPFRVTGKFPAHYSMCRGDTKKMKAAFDKIGYSQTDIRTFYGHFYYDSIPGLKQIEDAFSALAARKNWSWYSSYAVIVARK